MPHTRDLKIAKLLHQSIGTFFHNPTLGVEVIIDHVQMSDRRNAEIYYKLGHKTPLEESNIIETHNKITELKPRLKKFISQTIQIKAIPRLHFHLKLYDQP